MVKSHIYVCNIERDIGVGRKVAACSLAQTYKTCGVLPLNVCNFLTEADTIPLLVSILHKKHPSRASTRKIWPKVRAMKKPRNSHKKHEKKMKRREQTQHHPAWQGHDSSCDGALRPRGPCHLPAPYPASYPALCRTRLGYLLRSQAPS